TALFLTTGPSTDGDKPMVDLIREEATACLGAAHAANFENKIVLSIAIRFMAEQLMVNRINDAAFVNAIDSNQTTRLLSKFRQLFGRDGHTVDVLQRVVLMTPENIHLNSFMYEPILDMSDEHLRTLYRDVASLH
ncbi:MAG: phage infection protein, partial [bacterium]